MGPYGHCSPRDHLSSLSVTVPMADTPSSLELWAATAGERPAERLTRRSITVGVAPAGWTVTADNLAGHPLGGLRLAVGFSAGPAYHWYAEIDTRKLRDGKVHRVTAQAVWAENAREWSVRCG